jgi:putative ABC transport system permease protein
MIKNYLKIAFRNVVKNRFSSIINIGGLAIGMAVAMLIGLWIYEARIITAIKRNTNKRT